MVQFQKVLTDSTMELGKLNDPGSGDCDILAEHQDRHGSGLDMESLNQLQTSWSSPCVCVCVYALGSAVGDQYIGGCQINAQYPERPGGEGVHFSTKVETTPRRLFGLIL